MKAAVITGMATGQLKLHLNLNAEKYPTYASVKNAIERYLQASGVQEAAPMDIGALKGPGKDNWKGQGQGQREEVEAGKGAGKRHGH